MMEKPAVRKIIDLKDKLDAYRASALATGKSKGPARPGNLALASAATGAAALAVAPAAEATIQYNAQQNIFLRGTLGITAYDGFALTYIDMDGDDNDDFIFFHGHKYTNTDTEINKYIALALPENDNASIVQTPGTEFYNIPIAKALSGNYNISNTLTGTRSEFWDDGLNILGLYVNYGGEIYGIGNFPDQGNKYLGVRFFSENDEEFHYGWIRVNVAANSTSITIIDWAWEDEADTPIQAGAGVVVVPTLNEWGLIVLMTLLAGAAAWKMNQPKPLLNT